MQTLFCSVKKNLNYGVVLVKKYCVLQLTNFCFNIRRNVRSLPLSI